MALFEWNEQFTIGISSIDKQHRVLVDYINRLHDGMMSGQSDESLKVVLDGLVDYTSTHFKYEEQLFRLHDYGNKEQHAEIHKKLIEEIVDFKGKLEKGDAAISSEIMSFLKKWLMEHILGEDKKYVELMKSKRVA